MKPAHRGRSRLPAALDRDRFERLYQACNRREYVYPDPLAVVLDFPNPIDREIAALVASSLAYGRVTQILSSLERVFKVTGESPGSYILSRTGEDIEADLADFKHRWTTGKDLAGLLIGAREILEEFGSLEAFFLTGMNEGDPNVLPALEAFVGGFGPRTGGSGSSLLASPAGGSACKRLNLFLRWMVRQDAVDPGGWTRVPPSLLVVPLDTHMLRISRTLGLTGRKQADLVCALEITQAFRAISPDDPVKYDFALTRFGIRNDLSMEEFFG
ncbi:MAG: TIGR02757 family protein [bacterium]|nr:MAG: TIGR02757 family protein [bacterium]